MLLRFCKLCYQNFDRSVIRVRRFAVKYSNDDSLEYCEEEEEDDEYADDKFEYQDNFINTENLKEQKKKCIIKCKRSQFDHYEDQVYPRFQAIPLASRGWHHRLSKGDYFTINPKDMPTEDLDETLTFRDINLHEQLVKNLESDNKVHPTIIQKLGIPEILNGKNVILTAETGCGKTLAFLVPILQQILQWKPQKDRGCNRPLGLILTPSRELAFQISREAKNLAKNLDININTLIGGRTKKFIMNPRVSEVDLVVSTIGVMKKLSNTKIYKLDEVRHVILDEADTLLDVTFKDELCDILSKIPISTERDPNLLYPQTAQITLNSATIPQDVSKILFDIVDADSFKLVTTGNEHLVRVPQKFMRLTGPQKSEELLKIVKSKIKSKTPIIVFCNTTSACEFASFFLKQFNINCIKLHKKVPRELRRKKFNEFQNGISNVLITTDAGARGLDTIIAKEVINYDFPLITSEYIHRCGRTGRIGSPKDCKVVNFISRPLEIILTSKIEFAIRKNKPIPMIDMIHEKDEESEFLESNPADEESETATDNLPESPGNIDTSFRVPQ